MHLDFFGIKVVQFRPHIHITTVRFANYSYIHILMSNYATRSPSKHGVIDMTKSNTVLETIKLRAPTM
jgi:hypothetical protein